MKSLSGYIPVRNGNSLDYAWQLAVESLLPICDEVVISDGESTDGTLQDALAWAEREPKLRVINFPWPVLPDPVAVAANLPGPPGDPFFLSKWLDYTRKQLRYGMQITLDADEVLHPEAYDEVKRCVNERGSRWITRFHFWKSPRFLVPDGWVAGRNVARLGPTELFMPSDNPYPDGEPEIRNRATFHDSLKIWHLGFLRKPKAFFAKSRVMHAAIANGFDPRLEEAERTGQPWYELSTFPAPLEPYDGPHPEIVKPWLRERGYDI